MRWVRRIPASHPFGFASLSAMAHRQIREHSPRARSQGRRVHHLPTRDLHLHRDLGISLGHDSVAALARFQLDNSDPLTSASCEIPPARHGSTWREIRSFNIEFTMREAGQKGKGPMKESTLAKITASV
jgi:hypothetical protein